METHPSAALVLSMGGARGIAHIGVIEALLAHGYHITSLAGSSMGALVGAMYATGRLEACKQWLCTWNRRKMWQLADLSLSRDGLVKGDRFIRELSRLLPDVNIEDLPLPYAALATDITSGEEVKFDHGSLFDAIRASISIPMLFRPFRQANRRLVDGGILNPLPLAHVTRTPGDQLIAVDVNAPDSPLRARRQLNPYQLMTRSSRLMMQQITRYQLAQTPPDLLISLCGDDYDMMEFFRAEEIVEAGRQAAKETLSRAAMLPQTHRSASANPRAD